MKEKVLHAFHMEVKKLALLNDLQIYELTNAIIEEARKDQEKVKKLIKKPRLAQSIASIICNSTITSTSRKVTLMDTAFVSFLISQQFSRFIHINNLKRKTLGVAVKSYINTKSNTPMVVKQKAKH